MGDARATEMAARGELNIGQLVRECHGHDAVTVGFSTCTGTVTAASEWGAPGERKRVRRALADSYEALLHATGMPAFLLCPLAAGDSGRALREPRLERAIGVIYRPQTERQSHWFAASIAQQYDALFTSTKRAQWSRSSAPRAGSWVNPPRPTRPRSEPRHDAEGAGLAAEAGTVGPSSRKRVRRRSV